MRQDRVVRSPGQLSLKFQIRIVKKITFVSNCTTLQQLASVN